MEWLPFVLVGAVVLVLLMLVLRGTGSRPSERLAPQACPRCDTAMETGAIEIKGTGLGFLVIGLSYQHLWWCPDSGGQEIILRSRVPVSAWRCGVCGTVIVPP